MSVNGFDDSKNKKEVYTKEEVDIKLGNKSEINHTHADYKVKGDFATIETSVTMVDDATDVEEEHYVCGSSLVDYPEGFTKDNCRVIGVEHKDNIVYKDWTTDYVYETTDFPKNITVLLNDQIGIQCCGSNLDIFSGYNPQTVRVTLMKI